jgi:2-iminobutanoate/2-iminopropanoate deaminase
LNCHLRKKIIEPSWEAKYSFSPAVITGVQDNMAGGPRRVRRRRLRSFASRNFDAQTRQAFKNLERTLQRAGGTLKNIVWMTVSVSDGRYSQRFTDIRKEIYGKDFPASTLLTAAASAAPNIMVEIRGVAVFAA